jgi:polyphosphate glucokinase
MPTKNRTSTGPRTLAIDIGGTGIKAMLLDAKGKALTERLRVPTPKPATPKNILDSIKTLAKQAGDFDRAGAGFPGVVSNGVVKTAPHLEKKWVGVHFDVELQNALGKPSRVANDAVLQGYPVITGRGIELVITMGTSMGSAIYVNGNAVPMEMGHHPIRHGHAYEDEVGNDAFKKYGKKKWNKNLKRVIALLDQTFNYDRLFIGGGNARHISFKLPKNIRVIDNAEGLFGAMALWKDAK